MKIAIVLASLLVATPATAEETHAKSPALAVSGGAVTFLGVGTGVGAGFVTAWAMSSHSCTDRGCSPPPVELMGFGVPMIAISVGAIAGGIVMMAIGLRREPLKTVSIAPAGIGLAW